MASKAPKLTPIPQRVYVTEDYSIFERSGSNRQTVLEKHQGLIQSMQTYGFIPSEHITCRPLGKDKKYVIKDGQHRLAAAEYLGLKVYWMVETIDFNIAMVNNAQKTWHLIDYAEMYAAQGVQAYQDGIDFMEQYDLAAGLAFTLLAGTSKITQKNPAFISGQFKVANRAWAERVVQTHRALVDLKPGLRSARVVEACVAACRVKGFDTARLIANAKRCPEKLLPFSTRDACLDMFEEIYNYGRQAKSLVGLRTAARAAMRQRMTRKKPGEPAKRKKQAPKRAAKRTTKRPTKRPKRAK